MAGVQPLSFGELLRRYRIGAGLTQEELAEQAGLSARAIGALETGARRAPRKDTIALLTKALGLTPVEHALLASAASQRLPALAPQQRILAGAQAQAPSVERHESVLVGRWQELTALGRHLASEGPPLFMLAGEPGIGKSRLLEEAARRAAEQGWTVLAGGCHRRSGQEPFAPFVGALTHFLAIRSLAQHRLDLRGCAWLVRLLPELADRSVVPATSWTLPPEQERRLMFAAVVHLLANVAGPAGTLLVLDDLHWAGADALDLLAALLREPVSRPLRIVAAYRDTDIEPRDPLPLLLGDLMRDGLAVHTSLPLLGREDARELLSELLAEEQESRRMLVDTLLDRAGGLPLFLVSCAQDLRAGTLIAGATSSAVPWSAAESIQQRVAILPEAAQDVLAVAAVAGRGAPRPVLLTAARATGQDEANILAGLDAARRARLLVEATDGSYVFTHDLIRETVAANLGGARRAVLHRRVGEALEQQPQPQRQVSELAWHFAEGDEPARALPYALQAGDQAEVVYAHAEAERQYRLAVQLAGAVGDRVREGVALEKRADVLYRLARYADAYACLEQAISIYRADENWERLAWATAQIARAGDPLGKVEASLERLQELLFTLAMVAESRGDDNAKMSAQRVEAVPVSEDTLMAQAAQAVAILTPRTAARAYLCLTSRLIFVGRYEEGYTASEKTVECARVAHDRRIESLAYAFRAQALHAQGRLDEARAAVEAAHAAALASGDLEAMYMALSQLCDILVLQGEPLRCRDVLLELLRTVKQLGDVNTIIGTLCSLAYSTFIVGDWAEACRCYEEAIAIARQAPALFLEVPATGLAQVHLFQGRLDAYGSSPEGILAQAAQSKDPLVQAFAARALAERDLITGNALAARWRLMPLVDGASPDLLLVADLLSLLAWAELELGDVGQALEALTQARQRAETKQSRMAHNSIWPIEALIATRWGRWEEAQHALDETLALCQAMPYPYAEAKALYVYGQLHEAKGEPERARERYEQALVICNRLGERLYGDRIERALAELSPKC